MNEKLLKTNIRQYLLVINILLLLQKLQNFRFNLVCSTYPRALNSRIIKHHAYFNINHIFKNNITSNQSILYHIIEIQLFNINQTELELHTIIELKLLIIMYM